MFAKMIATTVGGVLMAISLSACSGSNDTQYSAPAKPAAAKCSKLSVQKISKRDVQLTAKAKWSKSAKVNPMRGFEFQLVDLKRDREPYHFLVPTSKRKATFTFDEVKPSKYLAKVIIHTSAGAQEVGKNCKTKIRIR